ncbi:hypothetical protein ABE547_13900 [Dorea sp. YH-dor226]|uniref:hypothetical protein n=1 Tax=Dorea sp. YH-dor226 TaxID=3151119 RepID=UPI003242C36A
MARSITKSISRFARNTLDCLNYVRKLKDLETFKIVCGSCNKVFARKGWRSSTGFDRKIWKCSERYKVKDVMGCSNRAGGASGRDSD